VPLHFQTGVTSWNNVSKNIFIIQVISKGCVRPSDGFYRVGSMWGQWIESCGRIWSAETDCANLFGHEHILRSSLHFMKP